EPRNFDVMRNRDVDDGTGPISSRYRHTRNSSIRNDVNVAFKVAQNCGPQAHVFNGTFKVANADRIADGVLVFQQNEESRNDILHQRLSPKAHRKAENSRAGQQRAGVDTEFMNDHHRGRAPYDDPADASNNVTKRFGSLLDSGSSQNVV